MMILIRKNGSQDGKTRFIVVRALNSAKDIAADITFFADGNEWVLTRRGSGRIERFDRLAEAREEALKT